MDPELTPDSPSSLPSNGEDQASRLEETQGHPLERRSFKRLRDFVAVSPSNRTGDINALNFRPLSLLAAGSATTTTTLAGTKLLAAVPNFMESQWV